MILLYTSIHREYFDNNDDQELLEFIQNEVHNYQWPLKEYIGIQGQRAWRGLKLAADITNLNHDFISYYHSDLDWIAVDDNYGSFNQRTFLIARNFNQRLQTKN